MNLYTLASIYLGFLGLQSAQTRNLRRIEATASLNLWSYFTNWNVYSSNEGYEPKQLPDSLTGGLYAFAQVGNCAAPYAADECNSGAYATGVQDWKVYATDPYSDFNTVPAAYNLEGTTGLGNMAKVINQMHEKSRPALLSVGGYTLSWQVFEAMRAEHRDTYVSSMVDFLKSVAGDNKGVTFDGVDTDIEPNNAQWTFLDEPDAVNRLSDILVTAEKMRTTLQAEFGSSFLSTAAWPASSIIIAKAETVMPGFWQAWLDQLNNVNVMNYDYHGDFDSPAITNFNAPLAYDPAEPAEVSNRDIFNIRSTSDAYRLVLKSGASGMKKLNLGLPIYGRGLAGVSEGAEACPGVYQTFTGAWIDNNHPDGMFSNDDIEAMVSSGVLVACYYESAGQWTAYGQVDSQNVWISFDREDSVQYKLAVIEEYGFGGAFFWEAAYDQSGAYTDAVASYLFGVKCDESADNSKGNQWLVPAGVGAAVGLVTGVVATLFAQKMYNSDYTVLGYRPLSRGLSLHRGHG